MSSPPSPIRTLLPERLKPQNITVSPSNLTVHAVGWVGVWAIHRTVGGLGSNPSVSVYFLTQKWGHTKETEADPRRTLPLSVLSPRG